MVRLYCPYGDTRIDERWREGTDARLGGLWRHPDFLKLWAGQTVSLFGSAFTTLALPLTAVLVLGATPLAIGLLAAIGGDV